MLPDLLFGVVGAGWAAREHCLSLLRLTGVRIVGVFDVDHASASRLAEDFGAEVFESVESLLDRGGLDGLIVATPSGVHREAVVPALERGISVFVEKPLARTVADAEAIVEAAVRSGTVCAVGYQWRAVDDLLRLRAQLAGDRIALLISQGMSVTQVRPWFSDAQLSGGLVFERVSHHIDLQRMLAGQVSGVTAARGKVPISGVGGKSGRCEDVISLSLEFVSGAVGGIHVCWTPSDYPSTQSLRIFTDVSAYDVDLDPVFSFRRQGQSSVLSTSAEQPFLRQMRNFLKATRNHDVAGVCCTAGEAAGTVVVAAAAERALTQGQQFVQQQEAANAATMTEGTP